MTSILIGLTLGLLASLLAWWLVVRAIAPKLELSQEISKLPDPRRPGRWRYRIKVVNLRRWFLPHTPAVEIRVVASLRLKEFGGYRDWTDFPIPISHSGEMDMIERNALPRLRLFDMRPDHLERLIDEHVEHVDGRDVELEQLLGFGAASEVRVVVSAAHPYTGARRFVSERYSQADIACGLFWNRPGKAGLRVARSPARCREDAPDSDQASEAATGTDSSARTRVELVRLFQYGSNMSERRLISAIQRYASFAPAGTSLGVRLIGPARLQGWSLEFDLFSAGQQSLAADIIKADETNEVWGAVYELSSELVIRSNGERSVLDRIEGRRTVRDPENYRVVRITVDVDGAPAAALAYVGTDEARLRCRTSHAAAGLSSEYASSMLEGVAALDFPVRYKQRVESLIEQQRSA